MSQPSLFFSSPINPTWGLLRGMIWNQAHIVPIFTKIFQFSHYPTMYPIKIILNIQESNLI